MMAILATVTRPVSLMATVLSAGGRGVGGDRDIIIVALAGDADSNTLVNSLDVSAVNEYASEPISEANCRYDVNCNGLINSQDLLAVNAKNGHLASSCQ